MRDRGIIWLGGEKTVVQKRTLEDGVDEEIEKVPYEEEPQGARGGDGENAEGERVGGDEEEDDSEEG